MGGGGSKKSQKGNIEAPDRLHSVLKEKKRDRGCRRRFLPKDLSQGYRKSWGRILDWGMVPDLYEV